MTPAAISKDPVARAAVKQVREFDRFLAQHGATGSARIPEAFEVVLTAGEPNASGEPDRITLGSHPEYLRHHMARSSEIVGHELTHSVHTRANIPVDLGSGEGWGDIIGWNFARTVGAPGSDNYLVGEREFTKQYQEVGTRNLANPTIPDIDALGLYMEMAGEYGADPHMTAGPLTRAATLVGDATSQATMGAIFTNAFLHDLAPRLRAADSAVGHVARDPLIDDGAPMRDPVNELRASARATMDAAARLHGPKSNELAAVRQAWNAVGLKDLNWKPRAER